MSYYVTEIDRIARERQRDVLFLRFFDPTIKDRVDDYRAACAPLKCRVAFDPEAPVFKAWKWHRHVECKDLPSRRETLEWLDSQRIEWLPCGEVEVATEYFGGYEGNVFIDLPDDHKLLDVRRLANSLGHPGGSLYDPYVHAYLLTLADAEANAQGDGKRDDPQFWQLWPMKS